MQPKPRYIYIFCLFSAIFMALALVAPFQAIGATAGSLDIRVSDIADDAVEDATAVVTTSIDVLPLGESGTTCGIRFQNVAVPQGSYISEAYIQFTADTFSNDPGDLTFYGELIENAPAFDPATLNDIGRRDETKTFVTWTGVPAWGDVVQTGVGVQTLSLKSIVQEIVDQGGWIAGNAMVFKVVGTGGVRIAQAYQSGSEIAPLLHIEYAAAAIDIRVSTGSDDAEEWLLDNTMHIDSPDLDMDGTKVIGVRFRNIDIPRGAIITRAYLEFSAAYTNDVKSKININMQYDVNPVTFSATNNDISSRAVMKHPIQWKPVPDWDTLHATYRTPDLTEKVQSIVGRSDWVAGNAMAFIIEAVVSQRRAMTYEGSMSELGMPDLAPLLHIEYATDAVPYIGTDTQVLGGSTTVGNSPAADTLIISNLGNTVNLNYTISIDPAATSWFSLSSAGGTLAAGSSQTVNVTYDTSSLLVGIYEATLIIEDINAVNNPVEIQVSVTIFPEPIISDCNIPVYVENVVSPAILVLLDVSGSMDTLMDVTQDQSNPQTPDLKDIVQEIVDRGGWQSGNPMAFIIGGTGRRTAKSYDGQSGSAPLLHVEYNDGMDHELNLRVSQSADDAEERIGETWVHVTSADLEMVDDNGIADQIIGIRFRNVTIPNGAIITNAYIEFVIDESDSVDTALTIWGEDLDYPPQYANMDNNISNRTKTSASVAWNMTATEAWNAATQEPRIEIGKSVISELFKDRSISWGFGTWTASSWGYDETNDYTRIHVGCKFNDADQQTALQNAVAQVRSRRMTPFGPSIKAAEKYFTGLKADESGEFFENYDCQPKFMINVTDGRGNTGSTVEIVHNNTDALADADVSAVGIGFGLSYDEAEQLYEMAAVANDRGDDSTTDQLYDMHPVEGGVVGPYFAFNKEELTNSLAAITDRVKGIIFHGSAPAPTTSADLGDMVILARFDASRWTGDVVAVKKDANGLWTDQQWSAKAQLSSRNIWTVDPDFMTVARPNGILDPIVLDCLGTDKKPIGDIINSTPVVVGYPPFYYPFDNYFDFAQNLQRDAMVYIGANDGSLHAIDLTTGEERWAFIPIGMHEKLNRGASDETLDRCATAYCHEYYIDGSPQVGDVYAKFGGIDKQWRTLLVVGEREGGETYFALDVTTGKDFGDSSPTEYLWEFTDHELGQTWAEPSIARVAEKSPSTETTWGVFFGSGYHKDPTDQATKEAYLYGIQADDASHLWMDSDGYTTNRVKVSGTTFWIANVTNHTKADSSKQFAIGETVVGQTSLAQAKILKITWTTATDSVIIFSNLSGTFSDNEIIKGKTEPNHSATLVGNLQAGALPDDALASPLMVNREDFYISDRIYAGNLYGNMYRVTNIGKHMVPQVSRLFAFDPADQNHDHPIRGKADYAYSETHGEIWIYFGTGKYEAQADKQDDNQQYFFGLKDDGSDPLPEYTLNSIPVELEARFYTTTIDGNDITVRYVQGSNPNADSWKMKLYTKSNPFPNGPAAAGSERVFSQPLVVGGIVFFTTFIPDENVCAGTGESWLIAVDYNTGQGATLPVFDINNDGNFDDSDKVLVDGEYVVPIGIKVGRGRGSHPVLHKDTMFVTITGDGDDDDDDDFFSGKVNIPGKKIRVETWRQSN